MISLLTLLRDRRPQYANLCRFLNNQSRKPDELVVSVMDSDPFPECDELDFPVRIARIESEALPLAAARNLAARTAQGEYLIFLDVDCLPSRTLVEGYENCLSDVPDTCFMGEVYYLPQLSNPEYLLPNSEAYLNQIGKPHPAKPVFPRKSWVEEDDYGELWGLSFAISRTAFEAAGGFDEKYVGYGAEETDFARRLALAGIPLARCAGARAYHQHHPVCIPPLQHFDSIIRNARLFKSIWSYWPMTYWLGQFAQAGFIEWNESSDDITVLLSPTQADVDNARQPETVRYS